MQLTIDPIAPVTTFHGHQPISLIAREQDGAQHITEKCRCGWVRHSEVWPFAEVTGEWVEPTTK